MSFGNQLFKEFRKKIKSNRGKLDEVALFKGLIDAIETVATLRGYRSTGIEIHRSLVNFCKETGRDFYYSKELNEYVPCELADIMFIVYDENEARLCFMQNKFDKERRYCRFYDFVADVRQLYLLKNRPMFQNGKKHDDSKTQIDILYNARYSSISNYGVFFKKRASEEYDMEYYNADAIIEPCEGGRTRVVKLNRNYRKYTTVDNKNDQLNYARSIRSFGEGLVRKKIGEKYSDIDSLLRAINIKEVIDYFRKIEATNVKYDSDRNSVLARVVLIIEV